MNIASVVQNDLANGPGLRTSIFVAGCPIHCPGCHNPALWDYNAGTPINEEITTKIISSLTEDGVKRGLSVLGGEPLAPPNIEGVIKLIKQARDQIPDLNVWLWTGYEINKLTEKNFCNILDIVDVVVANPFIEAQKDGKSLWRGSSNQVIWDCKAKKPIV